jgi:hypothetical protein
MSHLLLALALSAVLACSGSKPAESPAAVPEEPGTAHPGAAETGAAEPAEAKPPAGSERGAAAAEPAASQAVSMTLFVASTLVDCQGEAPQKCLQVRESSSEPYRNLYAGIAGFQHEPGYEYELRVEATAVPGAPADAASVRYRLLEVVAKRKAPAASSP